MKRIILALFLAGIFSSTTSAAVKVLEAFEGDGFGSWKEEGTAFGKAPAPGLVKGLDGELSAYSGESLACSAHGGMKAKGSLTSAEFSIPEPYLVFLVAGGKQPGKLAVQLLVDGKVQKEATGNQSLNCEIVVWDLTALQGKKARLRLIDEATGDWGFLAVDHFMFTHYPNQKFPPQTKGNRPYTKGLVSSSVLPGVTVPEGVSAKIVADHAKQKITSPTALCFDEQGKIYVSETHRFRFGVEDNRDGLFWYLDDLAAQKVEDRRKLHEKWQAKKSLASLTERSELVRMLHDADGDGVFETTKDFAGGFNDVLDGTAAGIFALEGTVYFACIPNIWTLRDDNGDGVADQKKVMQEGFGVRISFSGHDLNGFALGPDGMIYGTIGDRGLSLTTKEGKSYSYPGEGAAFRFEPDGSRFELVHTGLRNPKEIAFDVEGNAISVDNNSDQGDKARIVYIVPEGDSGWQMEHQAMHTFYKQIGLDKHPVNRWMAERMWEPQNDEQPAFMLPPVANFTSGPSGLTYHPGAGFLASEVGRFLICDYRGAPAGSGIHSFTVAPEGAGLKLTDSREFNWGVAATDVEYSYDGKLFVADYMGGWTSHEDGRIYSLDAEKNTYLPEAVAQTKQWFAEGFAKRTTTELAEMLGHADMRVRLRAQVELTRRNEGLAALESALTSKDPLVKRHALWGIGIIARRGVTANAEGKEMSRAQGQLILLLKDLDAETRAQALRMLCDVRDLPVDLLPLAALLKDSSARVVFYAAMVAAKHEAKHIVPEIVEMIRRNQDRDPYLRHAGSYALSRLLTESDFAQWMKEKNPSIQLALVCALRRTKSPLLENFLHHENARVSDEAIRAIHDQMIEKSRPAVAALLDQRKGVNRSEIMWRRLLHSAFRLGGVNNAQRLLDAASDEKLPALVREEAMRLLSEWPKPFPVEQSIGFYAPMPERSADEVKPVLKKGLPQLIRSGGSVLAKALSLVEQYDLTIAELSPSDLEKIVDDASLPVAARTKAMDLFLQSKSAPREAALERWSLDSQAAIALAALAEMVKKQPVKALVPLRKLLKHADAAKAQGAWSLLSNIAGADAAQLIVQGLQDLTDKKGALPYGIELLETAESRTEPEVKAALEQWRASLSAKDELAVWMPAVHGGNAKRGEQIYLSHPAECMRCHRAGDGHEAGGEAGPNLAGVGKRGDARFMMESMMVPSAQVAAGYGVVSATLRDGQTISGVLLKQTDEWIQVNVGEHISQVNRKDIAEMMPPISAMPPMHTLLKPREARDLVAWLLSLKKAKPVAKSNQKIVPVTVSNEVKSKPEEVSSKSSASEVALADVLKLGKQQYMLCAACHGMDGSGAGGAGPALAGSEWVAGPVENLIRIQLRGLMGPISVKGSEFNGVMPPQAHQSDEQVAAVLTYIRQNFGNQASAVTADQVAALRSEVGKPMLTVADLVPPTTNEKASADASNEATTPALRLGFFQRLGLPWWAASLFIVWVAGCVWLGLRRQS
jgi:quinoprotein glucose dehydrogenase